MWPLPFESGSRCMRSKEYFHQKRVRVWKMTLALPRYGHKRVPRLLLCKTYSCGEAVLPSNGIISMKSWYGFEDVRRDTCLWQGVIRFKVAAEPCTLRFAKNVSPNINRNKTPYMMLYIGIRNPSMISQLIDASICITITISPTAF
jgi:hypothetical protein